MLREDITNLEGLDFFMEKLSEATSNNWFINNYHKRMKSLANLLRKKEIEEKNAQLKAQKKLEKRKKKLEEKSLLTDSKEDSDCMEIVDELLPANTSVLTAASNADVEIISPVKSTSKELKRSAEDAFSPRHKRLKVEKVIELSSDSEDNSKYCAFSSLTKKGSKGIESKEDSEDDSKTEGGTNSLQLKLSAEALLDIKVNNSVIHDCYVSEIPDGRVSAVQYVSNKLSELEVMVLDVCGTVSKVKELTEQYNNNPQLNTLLELANCTKSLAMYVYGTKKRSVGANHIRALTHIMSRLRNTPGQAVTKIDKLVITGELMALFNVDLSRIEDVYKASLDYIQDSLSQLNKSLLQNTQPSTVTKIDINCVSPSKEKTNNSKKTNINEETKNIGNPKVSKKAKKKKENQKNKLRSSKNKKVSEEKKAVNNVQNNKNKQLSGSKLTNVVKQMKNNLKKKKRIAAKAKKGKKETCEKVDSSNSPMTPKHKGGKKKNKLKKSRPQPPKKSPQNSSFTATVKKEKKNPKKSPQNSSFTATVKKEKKNPKKSPQNSSLTATVKKEKKNPKKSPKKSPQNSSFTATVKKEKKNPKKSPQNSSLTATVKKEFPGAH